MQLCVSYPTLTHVVWFAVAWRDSSSLASMDPLTPPNPCMHLESHTYRLPFSLRITFQQYAAHARLTTWSCQICSSRKYWQCWIFPACQLSQPCLLMQMAFTWSASLVMAATEASQLSETVPCRYWLPSQSASQFSWLTFALFLWMDAVSIVRLINSSFWSPSIQRRHMLSTGCL